MAIMLASFTGENWSVTCEELESAVSLKQKLIEQIKESSNWHMLKELKKLMRYNQNLL